MHSQLVGVLVQHLAALLGDEDEVLDADAELAGQIDARLNGKAHPRGDDVLIDGGHIPGLVVLQADEVAQPVVEVGAVAPGGDDIPGGGVAFAYKLMMPFMLRFLSTGIEGAEYIQTTTSIESYVNLCLTMFMIFGCVFEMPLVTIILSKMGIIYPELLKKARGVAIVCIFFIAAVVTPPDIVSQCMVAGPMVLLYFVSILLSGLFYKPKSDEDDEDEDDSADEE